MPEYSEQDLKYATELREKIHKNAFRYIGLKYIKQSFLNTVRSRSGIQPFRCFQRQTPGSSCNYSHTVSLSSANFDTLAVALCQLNAV